MKLAKCKILPESANAISHGQPMGDFVSSIREISVTVHYNRDSSTILVGDALIHLHTYFT